MSISTEGKQKGWCFVYTGVFAHSCGWFLMRSVNQLEKSPNNNLPGDSGGEVHREFFDIDAKRDAAR